jgi:hypothetical protein
MKCATRRINPGFSFSHTVTSARAFSRYRVHRLWRPLPSTTRALALPLLIPKRTRDLRRIAPCSSIPFYAVIRRAFVKGDCSAAIAIRYECSSRAQCSEFERSWTAKGAEADIREVIRLQEKILGPDNPDTLDSCYNFASGLTRRGKIQEAKEFARRAAEGARKVLGPDHPSAHKYEKLLADLEAKH